VSVGLNEIRNRNAKRKTLKAQYEDQAGRRPPDWDDDALTNFIKTLKATKTQIASANAGVEREIDYLDKGICAMAAYILEMERKPQPTGDPEATRAWLTERDGIVDSFLTKIYTEMTDKPFGETELPDGSKQKEISGAIVEKHAEKSGKKGRKKKGEKDDGSDAEAASEVETTEIVDAEEETHILGALPEQAASKSSKQKLQEQVAAEEAKYESEKAPVDLGKKRKDKKAAGA